jgi:hypothetical protein
VNVQNILSTLAVMGLATLRETVVMPRIVNRQYEGAITGASKNATVNVVVPSAVDAQDVTPGATPPATASTTPTVVPVQLTYHKEAAFYLSDSDLEKVNAGIVPMQAAEAVKSLANAIDRSIHIDAYKKFYGFAGTPGTTPFATDLTAYQDARKAANKQLMPLNDRFVILDVDAESNAIGLRAFQDASFSGSTDVIVNGQIGRKLGALWLMSQNVQSHTSTALSAGNATINGAHAVGVKTVSIAKATNPSNLVAGDILTFAGDTQTYVVQANVTLAVGNTNVSIEPGLKVAQAGGAAVTLKASHVANLMIHRDAIAFAMAPMTESNLAPGLAFMQPIVDEVSGLSLRLELTREHKRWRWSFDALWGLAVPRPELGVRLAG